MHYPLKRTPISQNAVFRNVIEFIIYEEEKEFHYL